MKLRVVGWAYYDEDWPQGRHSWAARNAIVDEIKKKGYLFSGWAHQEADCCAPILNDGKIYCYSQRGWGDIMAEAPGHTERMAYARFAFMSDPDTEIRPEEGIDKAAFMLEKDLCERFELEVSEEVFKAAETAREIKLDDLPSLTYIDEGDTVALSCGGQTAEYTVKDVDRKKDFTEEEAFELEVDMHIYNDRERMARAEEKFNSAKIIVIIKLKKIRTGK